MERASGSGTLKIEKKVNNIDKLFTPATEINLFRMTQECINNVLKHSNATKVYLTISIRPDEVSIMIEDNGKGFDVQASRSKKGLGLMSLFNGKNIWCRIDITSSPDNGTTINILISPKN
jgi:signal transduction histidine kinase